MTWQQFYEMYDLYGEDNEVWNDFKEDNKGNIVDTIKDFLDWLAGTAVI
jgi:hypothetical protein